MRNEIRRRTLASGFLLVSAAFVCAFILLAGPFNGNKSSAKGNAEPTRPLELSASLDSRPQPGLRHLFTTDPLGRSDSSSLGLSSSAGDFSNFKLFSSGVRSIVSNARIASKADDSPNAITVAPPNDLCAGAEVIPGAGPFPYLTSITADVTDATTTGDPATRSCGGGTVSRSIWYTFTPSTTANYVISTCADSPTGSTLNDTVMAIYTSAGACAGAFTELPTTATTDGCDDDSCVSETFQSVIGTQLTGGTQYYILVWKSGATAPVAGDTAVQIRITQTIVPANDTCGSATPLLLNAPVDGTTAGATNDYTLSGTSCFTGVGQTSTTAPGRDVAYSFTAPTAGTYSFRLNTTNVAFDFATYLATSCPGAGAVTCNNVTGPATAAANRTTGAFALSEEVNCYSLTNGQQVFLFVDEVTATAGGAFTVEVNRCKVETEANNTPATASALPFAVEGSTNVAGDVDFYNLGTGIPAGARVFAMLDGVSANQADFDLRVTTTTDTLEFDDLNNEPPFGSLAPNIAGTPLTGTASFLRVNHSQPATASEPYRIYTVVQPPGAGLGGSSATAESEPNDTTGQANAATNNFFSGSLAGPAPSVDVDRFSFNAVAGELIFLSLDSDPLRDASPINALLALDDSSGNTLISVNDATVSSSNTPGAGSLTATTPNSPAESLVWRARYTGVYFARVAIGTVSNTSIGAGDYLVSISRNGQLGIPTASVSAVSGSILDGNGRGVEGVEMRLTGSQERISITDANGFYRFENVATNGFYTVTPRRANYVFSPADRSFSQIGESTEAAFTAIPNAGGFLNPLDDHGYFVRQHYVDFLGREPDEAGFNFWSDQILECGGDADCAEVRRINVSAAYFLSVELQATGGLVDGLYRASFGRAPKYAEFMPDTAMLSQNIIVGRGDWKANLETNIREFVSAFVSRAAFRTAYDGFSNASYVDALLGHSGINNNSERDALVNALNSGTSTRADVLLRVAENEEFMRAKRNAAFVMMEYFGYLRRDPDQSGYDFWLNKLNQFDGNFERAEMVKAFITSGEYRDRFAR